MAGGSVKLLSFWSSMFGIRVHYALALKGVEYDYQEENLHDKSEELVRANPVYKKIPVLIHNGKPICESLIIVDYIDNVWPDAHKLLPDDPYEKAVARFWADFGDKKIYEAGARIMRSPAGSEEQKKAIQDMVEIFKTLDEALGKTCKGKGPFFGGDKMNFADVGLAPFICWFDAYQVVGGFKLPGPEECPHVHKWMDAVKQIEALKKWTPSSDKLIEFVRFLQKKLQAAQ